MLDLHIFIWNQYNTISYTRMSQRGQQPYGFMCPAFCFALLHFIYSTEVQQGWHVVWAICIRIIHIYVLLLNVMNIGYHMVPISEQRKQIICWTKYRFTFCLNIHCEHPTSFFDFIISIHNLTPVYRILHLPRFSCNLGYGINYAV